MRARRYRKDGSVSSNGHSDYQSPPLEELNDSKSTTRATPNKSEKRKLSDGGNGLLEIVPLVPSQSKAQDVAVLALSSNSESTDQIASSGNDESPLLKKKSQRGFCCFCRGKKEASERIIEFNGNISFDTVIQPKRTFAKNIVNNCKYSLLTFLPLFLFQQFSQFGNFYFLCVAFSQLVPEFSIGYWWASWGPLTFVLLISMTREIIDDVQRSKRDYKVNNEKYQQIVSKSEQNTSYATQEISASHIKVGDLIILHENQRVPCDMILLHCSNPNGATFIKTDQLDGETDWKLRKSISNVQTLCENGQETQLASLRGELKVEAPHVALYEFLGTFTTETGVIEPLNLENTLWASTVMASGTVVGCAIYTGVDTRSQLNTEEKSIKLGRIDKELNYYLKWLFQLLLLLTITLSFAKGLSISTLPQLTLYFIRFILLLSQIIPISLRVYLDTAKVYFSKIMIEKDDQIPETTVRTTTIPEELGRIEYLFSDKTGTLTQNEMVFKKLQLTPPLLYENENINVVKHHIRQSFVKNVSSATAAVVSKRNDPKDEPSLLGDPSSYTSLNAKNYSKPKTDHKQVSDIVEALALCHNVTPILNESTNTVDYQASSPDEVALVRFTEQIGVKLIHRSNEEMTLQVQDVDIEYQILKVFPFTSESKRMGIIVKCEETQEIVFFVKGSDSIMTHLVETSDWLAEETENLAREGLRTLVFAKKVLTSQQYSEFEDHYHAASCAMQNRKAQMESVRETLEQSMELLGITGVEDKLQENVQNTLETLRNANIKIWMLTGDKVETAKVIAQSSRLISYNQETYDLIASSNREAQRRLDIFGGKNNNTAMIIDGKTLDIYLKHFKQQFVEYAVEAPVVVCCRCSPTQKAQMVQCVQEYTQKVTAAIGDGGNDVSMIQKAHVGIGIVGKEGQQASMASDFSINEFQYLSRLILWHGRVAYKQTATMAQFVIHRGLIIALLQAIFSAALYFSAIPLLPGVLAVGYACFYTSLPAYSFVMDHDITDKQALYFPELYHTLQRSDSLNNVTFLTWVLKSFYQGGIIMILSLILFDKSLHHIISISFSALIVTEIVNISLEIKHWNRLMVISQLISFVLYIATIFIFQSLFDIGFILSWRFLITTVITASASLIPVAIIKYIDYKLHPGPYAKLRESL